MPNTGGRFSGQQVTAGRFEKLEDGLVLPRRRVRHVDNDVGTIHRLGQALAGDTVDARAGLAASTSWPRSRRFFTSFDPMRPEPPMTTMFMGVLHVSTATIASV
jgi:hypothetical protein